MKPSVGLIMFVSNSNLLVQWTRTEFTTERKSLLLIEFSRSPYITCKRRDYLSTKLGIGKQHICAWFDRRRTHLRDCEVQINWNGNVDNYNHTNMSLCPNLSQFFLSICLYDHLFFLYNYLSFFCLSFGMNICVRVLFRFTKIIKDRRVLKVN